MTGNETRGRPLTLYLSEDVIPAQQFKSALDAFVDLLIEVSANFGAENKGHVQWGIAVREGSAIIQAFPSSEQPGLLAPLSNAIATGLAGLENGSERPPYFSDRALGAVRTLSKIATDELRVEIRATGIETQISEQSNIAVSNALDAKYTDYGSLDGYMQVLSTRGKTKATLFDDLTDRPISCIFEDSEEGVLDELFRAMRGKRRVEVSGLISYRTDGQPVRISVENFHIFPRQDSLPDIKDILGIFRTDRK